LPRYAAERVLLAPIDDVWRFVAEPYHLSDWWPGISGVEPDRRGLAPGARWKVQGPSYFRKPETPALLLIRDVAPLERFSFELSRERLLVELGIHHEQRLARGGDAAGDALANGHAGTLGDARAQPARGGQVQRPGRGYRRRHVGEHERQPLELDDRPAELDALGGPVGGDLQRPLGGAGRARGDHQPLLDEPLPRQVVAAADFPEDLV